MQTALFVAAGVALIAAFVYRSVRPDRIGPPWALFGVGAVLVVVALLAPNIGGGPDATVAFASPRDGATVPADEPITIEIDLEGADLATSASDAGGHLHIFVDGSVISMPMSTTAEVELEPGEHELKVEYVDFEHASYDPPIQETITVVAEEQD